MQPRTYSGSRVYDWFFIGKSARFFCCIFVAKLVIGQIKLQRDNKRNPRKYRKIPWIFEHEIKPEKAAAKFGKDEVASSNLASSSMFIQHFRCNLK